MNEIDLSDLSVVSSTEKPHLSDALYYPTDIAPHPIICLWSGVGSGKNTLIENIINGRPEKNIPRRTVLLISSRKSKVIETLNEKNLDISNHFTNSGNIKSILTETPHCPQDYCHVISDNGIPREIYQRSLVCTNAAIEAYHQYCFDPADPTTHLWNRFDMIVWDEVHSLIADSSFQSSPYHVLRLFQETYKQMKQQTNPPRCKNLILMTGTPEPLANVSMPDDMHLLNMLDVCLNVSPKNIHFLDSRRAQQQLKDQLNAGERVLYFANHISLPESLAEQYGIPREKIVVSFSDDERRTQLKNSENERLKQKNVVKNEPHSAEEENMNDYTRMENVEKYLSEHSSIRPDIALFYTTSRNKEGINIEDDDIRHIYIESHSMTDIKQMAGRIRSGAEHVYIIVDPIGHPNNEHPYEQEYAQEFCSPTLHTDGISTADAMLKKFCSERGVCPTDAYLSKAPEVGKYVDLLKQKSVYVEYDYFLRSFRFNRYHKLSREFAAAETKTFNDALESPADLSKLFQKTFPHTKIHAYISPIDEGTAYVRRYLEEHPEKYHPYTEIIAIAKHLKELIGAPKRSKSTKDEIGNPNYYLRKVGFQYDRRNHNKSHPYYEMCTLTPYSATKLPSDTAA